MNLKDIKSIIDDFEKSDLMALELETGDFKLKLSKRKDESITIESNVDNNKSVVIKEDVQAVSDTSDITSPLVGTFYGSANPDVEPFVRVGQKVNKGDVVCIIEAMKIMNEITSDVTGIITEVVANNEQIVGFGAVLFRVDQNDTK